MGYIQHNKEEHAKFKKLMKRVSKASEEEKKPLLEELLVEIYGHQNAEEQVVFPKVKENVQGKDLDTVLEMIEEHKLGNYQFGVLVRTSLENETWDAKFSVLQEVVEHHMEEEEQTFSAIAKKALSKQEREDIMPEFEKVSSEKKEEKKKDLQSK